MPRPVLEASIIFSGCFMVCMGLQEIFGAAGDPREIFGVGIPLSFGLSASFLPGLYARAPHFVQAFFIEPLPTTTILAVVLNQTVNLDIVLKNLMGKRGETS